jgi:hypothetical protein
LPCIDCAFVVTTNTSVHIYLLSTFIGVFCHLFRVARGFSDFTVSFCRHLSPFFMLCRMAESGEDARFSRARQDPLFKRVQQKKSKFKVDARFSRSVHARVRLDGRSEGVDSCNLSKYFCTCCGIGCLPILNSPRNVCAFHSPTCYRKRAACSGTIV